jgi:hypothetical protein
MYACFETRDGLFPTSTAPALHVAFFFFLHDEKATNSIRRGWIHLTRITSQLGRILFVGPSRDPLMGATLAPNPHVMQLLGLSRVLWRGVLVSELSTLDAKCFDRCRRSSDGYLVSEQSVKLESQFRSTPSRQECMRFMLITARTDILCAQQQQQQQRAEWVDACRSKSVVCSVTSSYCASPLALTHFGLVGAPLAVQTTRHTCFAWIAGRRIDQVGCVIKVIVLPLPKLSHFPCWHESATYLTLSSYYSSARAIWSAACGMPHTRQLSPQSNRLLPSQQWTTTTSTIQLSSQSNQTTFAVAAVFSPALLLGLSKGGLLIKSDTLSR